MTKHPQNSIVYVARQAGVWLGVTFTYVLLVAFSAARDWGDQAYERNPALQLHDKSSAIFNVGFVSGLYIVVIVVLVIKATKNSPSKPLRWLAIAILTVVSFGVVAQIAGPQIDATTNDAQYVQRQNR